MKLRLLASFVFAALATLPLSAESTYRIIAAGDLSSLASRFEPGDVILLPDVTWQDQRLTFRGTGTSEKPITLKATNPGRFVLTGKSSLMVEGEWLVVEDVILKDAGVEGAEGIGLKGSNHRLTSSVVDGSTHKYGVRLYGTNHRVDHCYFANKTTEGPTLQIEVDAKGPNHHRLDHNHFGFRPPLGANGGETIRIGYSHQSMNSSRTMVEQNLFEHCDGEIEIISSKSCDNIYRSNTFRECAGMLTLRHGNRNIVDGNFFLGGRKPDSGGIRVIGEDHVVINNYIEAVMKGGIWITCGVPDSALNQYYQVKRALIAFNTIVDSAGPCLDISAGLGGSGRTLKPKAISVANNVFVVGEGGALLQGDEGEEWEWMGNIATNTTRALPGIRLADAGLERARDGLFRPGPQSAVRQSAAGDFPNVTTDIDGQPRAGSKDVGCDEQSEAAPANRALSAADVGPKWHKR